MARKKYTKKKSRQMDDEDEVEEVDEKKPKRSLAGDVKRSIVAVLLFMLAVLLTLSFFGSAGSFGKSLNEGAAQLVGLVKFVMPIFLAGFGMILLFRKETFFYVTKVMGLLFTLISFAGFFHWFFDAPAMLAAASAGRGGGYLGYALDFILMKYLGSAGSLVVILAILFLGIILMFEFSIANFFIKLKERKNREAEEDEAAVEEVTALSADEGDGNIPETNDAARENEKAEDEIKAEENIAHIEFVEGRDQFVEPGILAEAEQLSQELEKKAMKKRSLDIENTLEEGSRSKAAKNSRWVFPPADLLEKSFGTAQGGDIEKNFSVIEKTLKDFGIQVERGTAKTGPSVTQYSFRPAVGVKISKILTLQNDLALALAAHSIRIEAPIPGQSLIGIEIPNKDSMVVRLRDMVEDPLFKRRSTNLTLALGEDISGECILADLSKMPHLMIAGATGTGKSVCINTIITSLLYQNSPEDLKFIMVDPKRVELSLYNGIPHLLTDVIVENAKVINTLKWAVSEMERRYRLLQDTGSRDIGSYQEKMKAGEKIKRKDPDTNDIFEEELKNLPYIIIVIDELADLMGTHGKEVEGAIVRLAQMARAVGIHLIISTQRPSVEVITGLIKANVTTRIAFQVGSQIDSRTILDMGGAEKLLGKGDMLYLSASSPKPRRIQGVFVGESEVKRVVKFISDQRKKDEVEDEENITEGAKQEILEFKDDSGDAGDDALVVAAKEEIKRSQKASASFLQRRLRIGYARAARLLDILEEQGIVGPQDGAKPRQIYLTDEKRDINYEDKINDQEKRDKWEL
ncbi:MAG: DNA translocase FtsK 4TM domain-containing protein [Parcubacteria group bacterium]